MYIFMISILAGLLAAVEFLRTVNGGATWQEDFASPQWAWSLYFLSPNLGWVGDGFSGYIRKTTDGDLPGSINLFHLIQE